MLFVSCASGHRCPATSLSAFPISSSLPRRDLETRRSMWPPRAIMGSQWFTRSIGRTQRSNLPGLILASARHIVTESNSVRSGGWQQTVGTDLRGKTLGVLGLGRVGSEVARVGSAFGMNLIAWSQNMTPEAAKAAGAILVSKDQLFERADILTIHLVLSSRTRGLVGASELERMKPTARLINASRGPIVEEQALISVLKNKQIAGAAIVVFDIEPLPPSHPFRTLDNVLATPHIGYVSHGLYKTFYEDTVSNIRKWLDTHWAPVA